MISKINETPDIVKMTIPRDQELRCPHYHDKKRGVCNKLFCKGRASREPQEFKCPNCGKKTIFQLIGE